MRTLTKKNLDEMARTMPVIPELELNGIVGAYDNDCFWCCVAYLCEPGIITEGQAAVYADDYFASLGHYYSYNLSITNNAQVTNVEMKQYAIDNSLSNKGIVGFSNEILCKYDGYTSTTGYHVLLYRGPDPNGGAILYDPKFNSTFTMSISDYNKMTFRI